MTTTKVARRSVAEDLSYILASPEVTRLIDELHATRWTGRPGYPIRSLIGMALAKSLYGLPTWTRTVRLVREHPALQAALGCEDGTPSEWACYRFTAKLRKHAPILDRCIADVIHALKKANPLLGWDVAIDASDMPAYANGKRHTWSGRQRDASEYSDPDASWGHRSAISTRGSGTFYGYKLHMAVCSKTDLPLAWRVETGKANESMVVAPLLDKLHTLGIDPETCAMDKGYDHRRVYNECDERNVLPIIPLRNSRDVKIGGHFAPFCKHGNWRFAGADRKRGATKWRCPTGECTPASTWVENSRLKPLIPRQTDRWSDLYQRRGSVERAFGRLKHEWGLALRVRRIERVRLHANLTILSQLVSALNRTQTQVAAA
ncbi:MAG TPA: transposase [Solirubrobacteraceae bacterium]